MAFGRMAAALAGALAIASPAAARDGGALARRAAELLPILNGGGDPRATFSRSFLKDVPEASLRQVVASVAAQLGKATGIARVDPLGADRADLLIAYQNGTAHALIVLAPGKSAPVTGFVIDRLVIADIAALRSLDDIAGAFARLPGVAGFAASDIEAGGTPLAAFEPDAPLAIASTFKLAILAELVRSIDAGERRWSDTVTLGVRELPAGGFDRVAPGTKVTLGKLAEEMIRVSDNSATDLLLFELGRQRVEGMLGPIGFSFADADMPLLSVLELFKLKGIAGGALGVRYLAASPVERRRLLEDEVARRPASAITRGDGDDAPVLIDGVEWFATPMDLVRAMGWFARHAQTRAGAEALRILALNPGPAQGLRGRFGYVGYKGGSEPGVVSMTVLVRDKVARWKVVTATWNDPAAPVDERRFEALMARALEILAGGREL